MIVSSELDNCFPGVKVSLMSFELDNCFSGLNVSLMSLIVDKEDDPEVINVFVLFLELLLPLMSFTTLKNVVKEKLY